MTKEFFGAVVVRKGWVREDVLLHVLAEQFGIPVVHLDPSAIDWTLNQRVPLTVQATQACVPVKLDAQTVTVAIANPLEAWAISELERVWPFRKIQLVLAPQKEILVAIERARQLAVQSLQGRPG